MARFCKNLPPGRGLNLAWSPPGLAVVRQFLSRNQCDELVGYLSQQASQDAKIKDVDHESHTVHTRVDRQRITKTVELGEMKETAIKYVTLAFRDITTPYFGANLASFSFPSALKYEPGGRFDSHADSEHWSPEESRWIRSQDRDYSILLYLNEDYQGGAISFPNFNLRIQPTRGMLITFPSDHRFVHAAEPLISGQRYVLVSWGLDAATPRLASQKF